VGDVIIDLDGHDVSRRNADEVNQMVKGAPNSPVTMILTRISPVYAAQAEEQIVVTLLRSGGAPRTRSMLGFAQSARAGASIPPTPPPATLREGGVVTVAQGRPTVNDLQKNLDRLRGAQGTDEILISEHTVCLQRANVY
jgi:hypothetical protein